MSTPENNVNRDSSSVSWFSWLFGAKRGQTAVFPDPTPLPVTKILTAQASVSPVAPESTGGDSSPDFINHDGLGSGPLLGEGSVLATPLSDAEPQGLPASEAQSPVNPDGHSAWDHIGTILGLDSCISPQKDGGEQFSSHCGIAVRIPSVEGAAAVVAHPEQSQDGPEHLSSENKETPSEIKKEQLSAHDKKIMRYRNYILVTSTIISTLGLGCYILWSKRSQDGSFDFTSISNAPQLCSDFLKSFIGTKTCSLSTELGFGDCTIDLAPPPKARL